MTYATMFKSGGNSENLRRTFNDLRTFVLAALTDYTTLSPPGLQIGTSSKKAIRAATAFSFTALGIPTAKAAAEVAFTATTHDVADGYSRWFTVCIDASGTLTIVPGTAVLTANESTAAKPDATAATAAVGWVLVAADSAIFNATTDDLDAAHLTVTYVDGDYASVNAAASPVPGFQLTER